MGDLQNTSTEGTQTGTEGTQKTFTQEDVNRIVQERLAKEKSKGQPGQTDTREADLDKREADLKAREQRYTTLSAIREAGLPDELADVIRCDSDDDLKKSLETIKKIIEERTPTEQDKENAANMAAFSFTAPMHNNSGGGDAIRSAMGLRG